MHSWRRRKCGQPLVEDVNNQAGRWYGSSASRMTLQESAHVPKVGHRAGGLRSRRREPRPASQRGGESDLPPDFSPRHRRRRRCRSAHSCSRRRHAVTAASVAPKRTNASRMTVQAGPPAPQQFLNPHADTLSCRDSLKGRLAHMWGSGALVMTHSEANTAEMAFLAVLWHQSDIAPSRVGADDPTSKQIPGHTVVFADVAGSPTHPHLVHGASRAARRRCLWSSSWLFRRRHARGSKGAGVTAATPLRKCPRILRYGCRPPIAGWGRGPATPPALPSHVRPIDQLGEPTLLICGPIGRGHESRHGAATGNVRLIGLWHVAVRAWSPDTPWLHQTPQGTLSWSGVRNAHGLPPLMAPSSGLRLSCSLLLLWPSQTCAFCQLTPARVSAGDPGGRRLLLARVGGPRETTGRQDLGPSRATRNAGVLCGDPPRWRGLSSVKDHDPPSPDGVFVFDRRRRDARVRPESVPYCWDGISRAAPSSTQEEAEGVGWQATSKSGQPGTTSRLSGHRSGVSRSTWTRSDAPTGPLDRERRPKSCDTSSNAGAAAGWPSQLGPGSRRAHAGGCAPGRRASGSRCPAWCHRGGALKLLTVATGAYKGRPPRQHLTDPHFRANAPQLPRSSLTPTGSPGSFVPTLSSPVSAPSRSSPPVAPILSSASA